MSWDGDYLLRYSPDEIIWHTRAILKKADDDRVLVLTREDRQRGGTEIFIYLRDIGGIFATVTAALDRLGLNILDARIMTSQHGYALDSFTVLEHGGRPISDRRRSKEIAAALRAQLNDPQGRRLESNRQPPRVLKHFDTPTSVNFEQDPGSGLTLLEIITGDPAGAAVPYRPGVLWTAVYSLGRQRSPPSANVPKDVFYLAGADGQPLDRSAQEGLKRRAGAASGNRLSFYPPCLSLKR